MDTNSDLDEIRQTALCGDALDLLCDIIEQLRHRVNEQDTIICGLESKIDNMIEDVVNLEADTYEPDE